MMKKLRACLPGRLIFGVKGDPGAVFRPNVDKEGTISWTNNGGLANPAPQNIRGPQGPEGPAGEVSDDKIAEAVKEYLDANPVEGGDGNALYYSEKTNVSGIAVVTIQKGAVSDEWTGLSGTPHVGDLVISATGQLFKVSEVNADTMYMGYIMDLKTALPENIVQSVNGMTPDENGNVDIDVPSVSSAAIGQTIVVKAVDENGKPTEWEAADLPSGGGGKTRKETVVTIEEEVERIVLPLQNYENAEILLFVHFGGTSFKFKLGFFFEPINNSKYINYACSTAQDAQWGGMYHILYDCSDTDDRFLFVRSKSAVLGWNGPYHSDTEDRGIVLIANTSGETFPVGTTIRLVEFY